MRTASMVWTVGLRATVQNTAAWPTWLNPTWPGLAEHWRITSYEEFRSIYRKSWRNSYTPAWLSKVQLSRWKWSTLSFSTTSRHCYGNRSHTPMIPEEKWRCTCTNIQILECLLNYFRPLWIWLEITMLVAGKWLENRLMAIFIAALILKFFFMIKVELKPWGIIAQAQFKNLRSNVHFLISCLRALLSHKIDQWSCLFYTSFRSYEGANDTNFASIVGC